MKAVKTVFGFIWALWGVIWFLSTTTVLTVVYAIILGLTGKKYLRACTWFNFHYASTFLLFLFAIRVKVFGKERLDKNRSYIVVANHNAQIDIVAGVYACPMPAKFLAKAEIRYVPFFGYMTKMLAITVDRKDKDSRGKSFRKMLEALKGGDSIFIYPEGTRNRTDETLKEFKDGAFRLAIMAQVPIAVQTLVGAREVNDPKGVSLLPGTIEAYWSEPIETTGMTQDDLPMLKEKVRQEMLKHLEGPSIAGKSKKVMGAAA